MVYSHRAAAQVPLVLAETRAAGGPGSTVDPAGAQVIPRRKTAGPDTLGVWSEQRQELRDLMWEDAGIVRSDARLERASERLAGLRTQVEQAYRAFVAVPELVELRNLIDAAALVVASARARRESRGLHYTVDHPYRDNERCLRDTIAPGHTGESRQA